ncbi:hypothetical protein TrVE_jg11371 [Triparma verrucosa]|uniref:Magnesium transporter n=2 Tax=Triparma TaxID=722752 RepID=A0A9W7AI68_9STRA|nr:hypothetical protein TrST_g3773 [Triparma strigata]GMH83598.1 hypothetical protein TrVE_jg11371 [Triparma verrucosa]
MREVEEWLYESKGDVKNIRILESLLSTGLHSLYARYRSTSSLLKPLLPLTRNSHSTPLITLLPLKNELDSLSKLLRDVENTLLETLREDVLGLKDSLGDCKEVDVEETLDDLVQQVEELRLKVDVRREEVRNSEEVLEIELSLVRNRILRFELGLGVAEICLGMAAAVTGFFGMNLLSGWEERERTFWTVGGGIVVVMMGMALVLGWKMKLDAMI